MSCCLIGNSMFMAPTNTPFISSWKTDNAGTSTSTQITIPTISGRKYGVKVDWGDGTLSFITSQSDAAWTHTYGVAGTYTVTIYGFFGGMAFNNGGDCLKLLTISQWGNQFRLGTSGGTYFFGCANLTISATDPLILIGTTSLASAFRGCTSLTTLPSIASWDTSRVTSMSNMFNGCTSFNQNIPFNTVRVTNFSAMFNSCTVFNGTVALDTSAATNMNSMFRTCVAFNQSVSSFDTSHVTAMNLMFDGCTVFNQDVSNFNTASVTTMDTMFRNCAAFNQSLSAFNTSSCNDMGAMFNGCTVFNQAVSTFNTALVTDMGSMFRSCVAFDQDISGWSIAALTGASNMFLGSGFTITNYNKLLDSATGWPSQGTIQNNVVFSAGSAHYSGANAIAGRAVLTGTHTWTVT